jgi:mevalonate kinase
MRIEVPEEHHATHPFASLKDFVFHILTISLGLGLALAGEGAVEHYNHRALANETREYFRTQLEDNRKAVATHQKATAEMQAALLKTVVLLDTDFAGAKKVLIDAPHEFLDLNTGSWDPAVATGALNYMPLREVQAYSQIHVSELSLNRLNRENEDVWFDGSEYNAQTAELDKNDLKSLKKILRKAAMYSKRIGLQEQELMKMYDQAEK